MVDSHDAETYSAKDSRLIWIDCEMTGLDIFGGDELVEVSVVPTDFDLNVLDEGVDYVIKPSCASRRKACARCWPATPLAPTRSSSTITCRTS